MIDTTPFRDICRHCDAEILRAYGAKSEYLVLDAEPDPAHGTLAISLGTAGKVLEGRPVTVGQAVGMRRAGLPLYADHGLTCPRAAEWHKVKTHGKATRRLRTRR